MEKGKISQIAQTALVHRFFLLTVFWTTLVSDDNIPIALPTADDPSPTAASVSLLASPAPEIDRT